MEVYIVHFTTGEYSDRSERVEGVFDSKDKAEQYLAEKSRLLDEYGLNMSGNNDNCLNFKFRQSEEVLALFGPVDYTGGRYLIDGPYDLQ